MPIGFKVTPKEIYDIVATEANPKENPTAKSRFSLLRFIGDTTPSMIRCTAGHTDTRPSRLNKAMIEESLTPVTLKNMPSYFMHGTTEQRAAQILASELKCGGPAGGRMFNYGASAPWGTPATRQGARARDTHSIYFNIKALVEAEFPLYWCSDPKKNPTAAICCSIAIPSAFIICIVENETSKIYWCPEAGDLTDEDQAVIKAVAPVEIVEDDDVPMETTAMKPKPKARPQVKKHSGDAEGGLGTVTGAGAAPSSSANEQHPSNEKTFKSADEINGITGSYCQVCKEKFGRDVFIKAGSGTCYICHSPSQAHDTATSRTNKANEVIEEKVKQKQEKQLKPLGGLTDEGLTAAILEAHDLKMSDQSMLDTYGDPRVSKFAQINRFKPGMKGAIKEDDTLSVADSVESRFSKAQNQKALKTMHPELPDEAIANMAMKGEIRPDQRSSARAIVRKMRTGPGKVHMEQLIKQTKNVIREGQLDMKMKFITNRRYREQM
ncbi:MAG: RNA 2'-phosphotransferase, partial [Roseovarius sp.]